MASLDEFPVSSVRDFIFLLNDRLKVKDGSMATSAAMSLTTEEARMVYAAMKWMELIKVQGSSLHQTVIPFSDCVDFIKAKAESLRKQTGDDRYLELNHYGIRAMKSIEIHIDQLAINREQQASSKKRNWKKK